MLQQEDTVEVLFFGAAAVLASSLVSFVTGWWRQEKSHGEYYVWHILHQASFIKHHPSSIPSLYEQWILS
jgi:hypothetical protein